MDENTKELAGTLETAIRRRLHHKHGSCEIELIMVSMGDAVGPTVDLNIEYLVENKEVWDTALRVTVDWCFQDGSFREE